MRIPMLKAGFVLAWGCLLLAVWPQVGLTHFCDDNYTNQQDRENCWWRYWNGLTTDADRAQPSATSSLPLGGMFCDSYYTDQQEREDCWWRHWNDLPLMTTELQSDSETPRTTTHSETPRATTHSISNPTSTLQTIPKLSGGHAPVDRRNPCGNRRKPGLSWDELVSGIDYECNGSTGKWVRVRVPKPGIDYATDCQLQPGSAGDCAGHTYYDPIRKMCITQPRTLTCH